MKQFITFLFLFSSFNQLNAQYYLRGSVRNEKNENLSNVQLYLHSDKNIYHSGSSGGFGVSSLKYTDSITFTAEGFENKTVKVSAAEFTEVVLHPLSTNSNKSRPKLISITKDSKLESRNIWSISDESYFSLVENEIVNTSSFPNTGFSLNVNKASYSNVRRFLKMKSVAPPDAVRTEELLNYFNLNYSEPTPGEYFKIESDYTSCPWSPKNRLLFMTINAKKIDLEKVPPSNLVFLIDASGSMDMPNRLPLVKAAFQMLVKNLRSIDTVSIVTYGGSVSVWLEPTGGDNKQKILKAIEELTAGGDTPGENGIKTAYKVAEKTFIKGGNNRVILATDGDFNVGEITE